MKLRVVPLILLLLGCFTLSSVCSACSSAGRQKTVDYLTAVSPDFQKSKADLEVFDEDYNDDLDGVTKVLEIVKNSKTQFQSRLDNVQRQQVPVKPKELKSFHNSLIQYYKDSIQLMDEYEQILKYSQDIYKSLSPIENAAAADLGKAPSVEEVKAMVKELKASLTESIKIAESSVPPQYMADTHSKYTAILTKYSSATDDFIYALQILDPLRINATTYRFELLSNKLMAIGDEMNADIEKQQAKMNELGTKLQKSQDDLYKQLLMWLGEYKIGG